MEPIQSICSDALSEEDDSFRPEQEYEPRLSLSFMDIGPSYLPVTESDRAESIIAIGEIFRPRIPVDHHAKLADLFEPQYYDYPPFFLRPEELPETVFPPRNNLCSLMSARYCHRHDRRILLLQTSGFCLNNDTDNATGGWAFVFAPPHPMEPAITGVIAGNFKGNPTSNRAEMMAVIVALQARSWPGEGFHTVVFATDSEYIIKGCTEWARNREAQCWKDQKNADLWKEMIWIIEYYKSRRLDIKFWRIPREWNCKASAAAIKAAAEVLT